MKDPERLEEAKTIFADTAIKLLSKGKNTWERRFGNDNFRSEYAMDKVTKWCIDIEQLCIYAKSQPQAAYTAFIHGIQHKYNYFLRTIERMDEFMLPLDRLLTEQFIPILLD